MDIITYVHRLKSSIKHMIIKMEIKRKYGYMFFIIDTTEI